MAAQRVFQRKRLCLGILSEVDGSSIIYFSSGLWRLNDEDDLDGRKYDGEAADDSHMPPSRWVRPVDVDVKYGRAPQLSLGSYQDLQEGDLVLFKVIFLFWALLKGLFGIFFYFF